MVITTATMAPGLSPPISPNPLRRIQHDHAPPPKFNLYDRERDTDTSTTTFSVFTVQGSRYSRSQSTPTSVQENLEKTPRSELPIRHDRRRPSLTKKPRSAPDTPKAISNDDLNQKPNLPNNRVMSPCGTRSYSSPGWRKRHEENCSVCRDINLKETSEVQVIRDTTPVSKRQAIPEAGEKRTNKTVDQQLREPGNQLHSANQKAPKNLEADYDRSPSFHSAENDLNVERVTSLSLDDEYNPEGKLMADSAKLEINATELHSRIRAVLERGLTSNDTGGYIYILSDPNRNGLHKIGRSKDPIRRKGQLQYQCGLALKLVNNVYVDNYSRTERLIQTYLLDLCRPYRCEVCGASHGEWFEIPAGSAEIAVSRWASFMTGENPYDLETRQLRLFAKDLVQRRDHLLAGANSKIETTREHWNRTLSPTTFERVRFKFIVVWDMLCKFHWQINAIFAWTVAFVASRHPLSFLFMAASVIGTFVSMSDEHHRLRNSLKSSKRKLV